MVSFTVRRGRLRGLERKRLDEKCRGSRKPLSATRESPALRRAPPIVVRRSLAGHDLGFTLIEVVITIAVIAATVAAGFGVSLASRSFAVASALNEFDHFLDNARTIARETEGATLVFAPDAYGDGTEVRVMVPGANATLVRTMMPIMHTRAAIQEAETLGQTPFAFVVHTSGALGGRPGFRLGDSTATAELGCPPSGHFHFVIRAGGATGDRYVPCRIDMAASGPVAYTTWAPATAPPAPTPCPGGCGRGSLPTPPSSAATCPPSYTPVPGGCTPNAAGASAPNYHVTASLAAPTMTVGGTDTVTAQATLTNAASAPPGTPPTLPVVIQTSAATCSATPPGSQTSGSTFTLTGLAPGTCTATVQADTSGTSGSTSDTVSLAVAVAGPSPSPTPQSCDLTENGKCYVRIISQTGQGFYKTVNPAKSCRSDPCSYIDSISSIELRPSYGFVAPIPPTDSSHELLFKIIRINSVTVGCQPYSSFAQVPGNIAIQWYPMTTGSVDQIGAGEPNVYTVINQITQQSSAGVGGFDEPSTYSWRGRTVADMFAAVSLGRIGSPFEFTYSSPLAAIEPFTMWFPDFAGCDAAGDSSSSDPEFGVSGLELVFEVYQAG